MTANNKPRTSNRLLLGFISVIFLFLAIGIISIIEMRILSNLTRTLYSHPLVVSNAALAADVEIIKMHRSMKDVVLMESAAAIQSAIEAVNQSEREVYRQLDIVAENILGEKGRGLARETRLWFDDWKPIRAAVIQLAIDGRQDRAAAITIGKGAEYVAELESRTLALTSYARKKADGFMGNAERVYERINRTSIIFIVTGSLLSMMVAFNTIRKVRKSEGNVREHLALVNGVIEGIGDPIFVKDTQTRLILANTATAKAWGKELGETMGRRNEEVMSERRAEKINQIDYAVMQSGDSQTIEEVLETNAGRQTYLTMITPLRAVKGEITGVIGISRNITNRKKAEEQIAASLREKEVLLREIHHRVKNNLQVISSLLNLQTHACGDDGESSILRASKSRIDVMAGVHEKLYQSEDLAEVIFDSYVESFVYELFHLYGVSMDRVRLSLTKSDLPLDIEIAIPCGLIINELISNALKYAFPNQKEGRIVVSLRRLDRNNRLELCVGDDGIGLMDDFNWDHIDSLGLRLVHILVHDQLEGDLEVDRSNGTLFRIRFAQS